MIRRPWFVVLAVLVVVALTAVLGLGHLRFHAAASRLPERGFIVETVLGCAQQVEVRLDNYGIPHVTAATEEDAWFAQGYMHARDRFFQMELARRTASGTLAEVFGEAALLSDRKMRTWRIVSSAGRQLTLLSEGELAVLEAYTAGVNAALEGFGDWIAPELWLLGVEPASWRPEDSLAIGVLLQLNLSWSMGEELQRAVVLARFGQEKAVDLWGWTPREARVWIPPVEPPATELQPEDAITPGLSGGGSNAWAIAPEKTAAGRPLLASDPHLGVSTPAVWHAIHLKAPELHVAGASIPGIPGIAVGHTEGVAWGFTMSMLDDQDLFVLTLDESRSRELIDGAWQPLRTVTETINVRWREAPEPLRVRLSERGPVVRESSREVLALAWGGLYGPSPFGAFLRMARSSNVAEVAAAWEDVVGPSMNLLAADVDGRILHQVVGMAPERTKGAGRLPAPGADSSWSWRGFLPMAANPHTADPVEGFLANANHDLFTEGDFAGSSSFPGDFMPPWRVRRIRAVLAARDDWDVQGCLELQRDAVSGRAIAILKQIWPELEGHDGATAHSLRNWDGSMQPGEVAPHLFSQLMLELSESIGGDEALREGLKESPVGPEELLRLLAGGLAEDWWDDLTTGRPEGRAEVVADSLDRMDRRWPFARWGEVHDLEFAHPLASFPLIGSLVRHAASRGPFPVAGNGATVNATHWSRRRPFAVTVIPTMRFVADVGNWDQTVLILPPGESGRPWSAHYADQLKPYLQGGNPRFPFTPEAVEKATRATLQLVPAR